MKQWELKKRYATTIIFASAILVLIVVVSCVSLSTTSSAPLDTQATPATEVVVPLPSATPRPPISVPPTAAPHPGRPLTNFASSDFSGSGNCAVCHSALTDSAGHDVSIDAHWRSAIMANSSKDPLWQAKVSSEVVRNPALQAVIEDKCATCHMPMARTQAVADSSPVSILNDGFLEPNNSLHEVAMDGVSCTLCHQIQDINLGKQESFSGYYQIDTNTVPPDRLIFGPFPQPVQNMMRSNVGFTPVQGRQVKDSALCATCHTLYTPYVDAEGKVVGEFPEQTPYLEWKHSEYGDGIGQDQTCQRCHMPSADGPVVISNRPRGRRLIARSPFGQHHFVGGNTFMLDLLKAHVEELGLTASTAHIDATLVRTVNQLQTDTAHLSIIDARVSGDALTVILNIENKAAHKFPSGFPSRRAWIHLTITDATGQVVFESGQPQAAGSIAGNNADENGTAYEPHHEVISSPDQVQIYESIMQNSDGEMTYTLLRAASYVKDNRLLPRGFDKGTASEDIAAWGGAASDDNFVGGSDRVTYQVSVQGYSRPFTVSAELLYQAVSYRFVLDLRQDSTSLIERFRRYYEDTDKMPTAIATVQKTVR